MTVQGKSKPRHLTKGARRIEILHALEQKLLWLSAWMIHHANHIRPNRDGLKVGGHQASCASCISILTALYFDILKPEDRVAVKPHAGPVFHAINYLLGRQSRDKLETLRQFGGIQPYPSRVKDGGGGFLHRLGRAWCGADVVRFAGAGLCAVASTGAGRSGSWAACGRGGRCRIG